MSPHRPYEYRDRAGSLRRMARETTDERARQVLNDLAAENLAKAEELERQEAPSQQSRSPQSKS
jgi:hypothetical protein